MRFEGKTAFVTGGGGGIGAATARKLAEEGASVAVADLDLGAAEATAGVVRGLGRPALALAFDVADAKAVDAAVERAAEELGRLDVLVACAGILRDSLLFRMSDDQWDSVIDTHLKGSFLVARAAQHVMVPRRYGRMVFTSSTSALGNRGQVNYAAAKAGIQGLTRTLAIELGPMGITVNAVAPGPIDTRMTRAVAEKLGIPWEEMAAAWAKDIPLGRVGQPGEVANVIAFLASDEASYVNGQVIYVAGGPRG